MKSWERFERWLTRRRQAYAWIAGGSMAMAWLLSVLLGNGLLDLGGHPVGTDYVQFYAAGMTVRMGESAHLYDFEYQRALEQQIIVPGFEGYYAFLNPPFLAWFFVPFSALGYTASFIAWVVFCLLLLGWCLRCLGLNHWKDFAWALSFFAIFANLSFGQNGLLSLAILTSVFLLLKKRHPLAAGLCFSLLLFKPQMMLGAGFLFLLEWRTYWKTLLGALCGGLILVGTSAWQMPQATLDYLQVARQLLPGITSWDGFPLWHSQTWRAFWLLLLPGAKTLADIIGLLFSLSGLVFFGVFWKKHRQDTALLYSAAILLTLWIAPHMMIYDWASLLLPAAVLLSRQASKPLPWKTVFGLMWLAAFVSGPLTILQLQISPLAVQLSMPILAISARRVWTLIHQPEHGEQTQAHPEDRADGV